jgi:PAS domain S-box-containing protein
MGSSAAFPKGFMRSEETMVKDPSHKSDEMFRLLVDAVTDYAIVALDTHGNILTWNKGAERLEGYSAQEIIGQHFSKFYTESDVQSGHPAEELRLALKDGKYEEESWRVKKDGSMFWANLVLTPLRDAQGKHIGFTKVTRDLTERKKSEDNRKEEEEKFRLMVDSVKDYAIFMLNSDGIVSSWNEGAKRFKGYEASEIIGQHFSKFYPPEDIKARKPQMELEVANATGRFEDEGWRIRKDGTRFWANVVITALFDKSRRLVGYSKVTRDLTERKRAEEGLRTAYEGLEARVKQKTGQLEEALRSRDEFLSIASHELKTPITGIKMQMQMALMRLTSPKSEGIDIAKQVKALQTCEGQLNRLTQLIDDLLDVSRIQAGKLDYNFELTNFSEILNEVLEGFSGQLAKANTEVKTFVDEDLQGYWDRTRLEQVLINIVSNALKYAPGSAIVVFAKQDEQSAVISIQDFGPGIPEKERSKIFGRFERLGQTRNVGGLGLGLYISRQIVTAHGGRLELKSSSDPGTTFIFTLPLDARPFHPDLAGDP